VPARIDPTKEGVMKAAKLWMVSAVIGMCVSAPAFAGPPFGGDVSGCVPDDKLGVGCGKVLTSALTKEGVGILKCHLAQANKAYQTGHSSNGFDNQEESCTADITTKIDGYMVKASAYCSASVIADIAARRATLLADASNPDSFDALNGSFYCDSTTGLTIAEPGGGDQDEAGFIPASDANRKCSLIVLKAYAKLLKSVYYCHNRMAMYAFSGKPFDENACEATPPKGALARYDGYIAKAITNGYCPPCLASTANALGADLVADLDAQNEEIYPCP
jgi:hypothetical protein